MTNTPHRFTVGDKRLLSLGLEQMTVKFGSAQDSIGRLKQAFDRLKKETGKPANFMYPEDELEQEMYGENARLQSQLLEAEDQISALELDNTRVRKAMKNQAGLIGEQGFKFQGMNSAMLVTVNEFASNLREGKVELPLNDRSAELLKENRRLRDEQKAMNLRVERYEREISGAIGPSQPAVESGPGSTPGTGGKGGSGGTVVSMSKVQEAELFGLRNDVQKLVSENTSMHGRMSTMQSELMAALKARGDGTGDGTDSIASALLAANEALMRELIDARSMAADRFTPRLDSLSEIEPSRQGLGQGQGLGYQPQAQLQLEGSGGGRYPSKLPPAGSRKTSFFAGGPQRGDLQQDSMFTPGTIVFHDCCLFGCQQHCTIVTGFFLFSIYWSAYNLTISLFLSVLI
jgi:hypothetical protein